MVKYKYRLGNGLAFSEGKDVRLMERMACKGYHLAGVNSLGFYKFEKAEPKDISYSVDFSMVLPCSDEFEFYKEIFQSGGWEYICSTGTLHWFKAEKGTTPIYTDKSNESDKYGNMFRFSCKLIVVALIAALIFLGVGKIVPGEILAILFSALFGACFGVAIVMTVGAILNYRKYRKLLKLK